MTPITLYSIPIDKTYYDVIKNFMEDEDIDNVPERKYMAFEIQSVEGYFERATPNFGTAYLMDNLEIVKTEGLEEGYEILLLTGNSPSLEELFYNFVEELDEDAPVISEEPNVSIVICNDYEGEYDLDFLTTKLKSYLGDVIKFSDIQTIYTNEDDILDILDGRHPFDD